MLDNSAIDILIERRATSRKARLTGGIVNSEVQEQQFIDNINNSRQEEEDSPIMRTT